MPGRILRGVLLAALTGWVLAAPAAADSVLWAVGDADAGAGSASVANRMGDGGDGLLYLGDVYENGTASDFALNFDPVWGRFKPKIHPTPGNHEWANRATGYDPYFGDRAPQTDGGHYYAFERDGWQFLSLNTEEPMALGSPQYEWLKRQVASGGSCRIAFFHAPRWSGGKHGDNPNVQPLWDLLAGRAVLALNGHDHNSQRAIPEAGITQLIAGAGGRSLYPVGTNPRIVWSNASEHAAVRLELGTAGEQGGTVRHAFVAADDGAVLDAGEHTCSRAPLPPATVTARFAPVADAAVREAVPTTNLGASTTLLSDGSPREQSSLRFDVSGVTGPVRSAYLRVFAVNGSVDGPAVHATSAAWSELATTWSTRPLPAGAAVADAAAITHGTWVGYDVTPLVTGDGVVDLTLAATSADGVDLASREASANRPELVVEFAPGDTPPDTTAPDTTIIAAPSATTPSGSAQFAFGATEPGATFACSVDGAPFTACATPMDLTGLGLGSHTLAVRATDAAGNPDETPATHAWTIVPSTRRFSPVADAPVRESAPTTTHPSAGLLADNSPREQSFLRFAISGLSGPVHSASLRLWASNGSVDGPALYRTVGSWAESTLTWANRPSTTGAALGDVGRVPHQSYVTYALPGSVAGNGTLELALVGTSGDGTDVASREARTSRPELTVVYGPTP